MESADRLKEVLMGARKIDLVNVAIDYWGIENSSEFCVQELVSKIMEECEEEEYRYVAGQLEAIVRERGKNDRWELEWEYRNAGDRLKGKLWDEILETRRRKLESGYRLRVGEYELEDKSWKEKWEMEEKCLEEKLEMDDKIRKDELDLKLKMLSEECDVEIARIRRIYYVVEPLEIESEESSSEERCELLEVVQASSSIESEGIVESNSDVNRLEDKRGTDCMGVNEDKCVDCCNEVQGNTSTGYDISPTNDERSVPEESLPDNLPEESCVASGQSGEVSCVQGFIAESVEENLGVEMTCVDERLDDRPSFCDLSEESYFESVEIVCASEKTLQVDEGVSVGNSENLLTELSCKKHEGNYSESGDIVCAEEEENVRTTEVVMEGFKGDPAVMLKNWSNSKRRYWSERFCQVDACRVIVLSNPEKGCRMRNSIKFWRKRIRYKRRDEKAKCEDKCFDGGGLVRLPGCSCRLMDPQHLFRPPDVG